MKHKHLKLFALFLLCMSFTSLYAQETTNTAGGRASGTGGSATYSVGQVVFTTQSENGGTITQGVQQPYEILVVTGIELSDIQLGISAYPNPTTDFLTLKIDNHDFKDLELQLYNSQGRMLRQETLLYQETQIEMQNLAPATYFVRITENNQIIKNFKIIKN